ncbi:MAG: hypothetical protein AAFN07_06740 [Pseudomonadota bacterium]
MRRSKYGLTLVVAWLAIGCTQSHSEEMTSDASELVQEKPAVSLGDGERNWIKVEDVTRDGAVLTVSEVLIEQAGFLVIHRFKDGKPYGKDYVASTFLNAGTNLDVPITLPEEPNPGTPLLIMLHSDVNQNGELDFVFVDEVNVLDKAVFEGSTMVAKIFTTP